MPYCPDCRFEYRPEIEKCPDCGSRLVDELPDPPAAEQELVRVADYFLQSDALTARMNLQRHGIKSVLGNEIMSGVSPVATLADGGIHLYVLASDEDEARRILAG